MSNEPGERLERRRRDVGSRPDKTSRGDSSARLVGRLYGASDRAMRAKLLACLLWPLSPLGRAAVAAGVFAKFVAADGVESILAAMDEATRFSNDQVAELARFAQQVSPQVLDRFVQLVTDNRIGTTGFGIAAAALLLKTLSQSRG
jgi:hypothetical protein